MVRVLAAAGPVKVAPLVMIGKELVSSMVPDSPVRSTAVAALALTCVMQYRISPARPVPVPVSPKLFTVQVCAAALAVARKRGASHTRLATKKDRTRKGDGGREATTCDIY